MSNYALSVGNDLDRNFCIESYGVRVKIESNDDALLEDAREVVRKAFVGKAQIIENGGGDAPLSYRIERLQRGKIALTLEGEYIPFGRSRRSFLKYFNSRLRLTVCEHAKSHVFVHAGVVAKNGKALIIPAQSFKGKTTLVAELVRNGAEYYSDEYAVLDEDGLCHPFPRTLSLRWIDGAYRDEEIPAEEFGRIGSEAVPVGMVLLTAFDKNAVWQPEILTVGRGVMEVIPHTIPIRANTEFSMAVLGIALSRAVFVKSTRGEAADFAKIVLSFFDDVVG